MRGYLGTRSPDQGIHFNLQQGHSRMVQILIGLFLHFYMILEIYTHLITTMSMRQQSLDRLSGNNVPGQQKSMVIFNLPTMAITQEQIQIKGRFTTVIHTLRIVQFSVNVGTNLALTLILKTGLLSFSNQWLKRYFLENHMLLM